MTNGPLIDWLPWGEAAFGRAVRDQRPILLRISASWCASCHQMAAEADMDPYVVSQIRESFVPVMVDSDRRPDINERYNMGGWPTNCFLTPKGDLITGGTFFDIDTFRLLLARVSQSWVERRAEVEEAVAATRRESEQRRRNRPSAAIPAIDAVTNITDLTMDEFDFRYGGFGRQMKFSHAESIELLMAEFCRTGEVRLREAALISLDAMWSTDTDRPRLADDGGGFFRYATNRDWTAPRYEKMLNENARLISVYLSAHQLTGEPHWAAAARETVDFVMRTLSDSDRGLFYSSQAAVLEDEYYGLGLTERQSAEPPPIDKTFIVSWNAEMASALLKAGLVLHEPRLVTFASGLVDRLVDLARLTEDDVLLGHIINDDGCEGPVLLASQVTVAKALVDTYEALGGVRRLDAASGLLDAVHARLRDSVKNVYTDTIVDVGSEGYLGHPLWPLMENCCAADTLMRLAVLLDSPEFESRAVKLLTNVYPLTGEYGFVAAPFALAVIRSLVKERLVVYLASDGSHDDCHDLAKAANSVYAPLKSIRFLDPERDRARLRALASATRTGPVGVVCLGATCAEPTRDPERLLALVARVANASFPRMT